MTKKVEINKEELYQYYVVEKHSRKKTAKYFGCSVNVIKSRLKEYGFKKIEIDGDKLYHYYIIENHNIRETAMYFKVSKNTITSHAKKYGFEKTKEQIGATQRATWLRNLGCEYPAQNFEVQTKTLATRIKKGSCLNNKNLNLDKIIEWLESRGIRGTTIPELAKFMDNNPSGAARFVHYHSLGEWIKRGFSVSKPEKEIRSFIKENYDGEVIYNDRKIIPPKEIDILIPDLKIGIEFNGLYHHRTCINPATKGHVDKYYHRNKAVAALEKGYRLYFITDDEWRNEQENVKSRILDILVNKQDLPAILGYTEPKYCYTNSRNRYFRNDKKLPGVLATAFALEDDGWELAENAGYYRYYDCGEPIYRSRI